LLHLLDRDDDNKKPDRNKGKQSAGASHWKQNCTYRRTDDAGQIHLNTAECHSGRQLPFF
jgi:hypothetical protein